MPNSLPGMDSGYFFEEFKPSHYHQFNALYKNAFGLTLKLEAFTRHFHTKPRGFDFVGFIAIHQQTGQAAAFYGVFPLKLKVGDSVIAGAVSGDTMTHSRHRNKGLFRTLATMTYQRCKKMGLELIYGFPNDLSYHGLVHSLGWKHTNDLAEWNLPLRPKISPVHKIIGRARFLKPLFLAYASRLLCKYLVADVDSFNHNHSGYGIVYRDSDYIKYKASKERVFIRIDNVIIWVRLSAFLWIGDFSDLQEVTDQVISKLKRLARLLGYNTIRYSINKEIQLPESMKDFSVRETMPLCVLYLVDEENFPDFLFTSADFDTW
jgi:Acetyltransferase (GNAT) domain